MSETFTIQPWPHPQCDFCELPARLIVWEDGGTQHPTLEGVLFAACSPCAARMFRGQAEAVGLVPRPGVATVLERHLAWQQGLPGT